jgi:alpha-tubulin suppressor-like RCC1 family protein
MTGVQAVSAGDLHTMILKTDGMLWATGRNAAGQLGDGTLTNRSSPVQVMTGVRAVSAGYSHTMIIKTDGTLWATGLNNEGQLGDGTVSFRVTPVRTVP